MGCGIGLIEGAGSGASSTGGSDGRSIDLSHNGICRHDPEVQSQVHWHDAMAPFAISRTATTPTTATRTDATRRRARSTPARSWTLRS